MKPCVIVAMLLASLQSSSQQLGYLDFVMNKPLTQSLLSQYHIESDTAKGRYIIDGKAQKLSFYGLPVDTIWIETGKLNLINAITIKTTPAKQQDFRDFNFDWTILLNHMSDDFGVYRAGEVRFTHTMAAVWLVKSEAWLYATTEKFYPWQKNQQRFVLIRWRKYNKAITLDM